MFIDVPDSMVMPKGKRKDASCILWHLFDPFWPNREGHTIARADFSFSYHSWFGLLKLALWQPTPGRK